MTEAYTRPQWVNYFNRALLPICRSPHWMMNVMKYRYTSGVCYNGDGGKDGDCTMKAQQNVVNNICLEQAWRIIVNILQPRKNELHENCRHISWHLLYLRCALYSLPGWVLSSCTQPRAQNTHCSISRTCVAWESVGKQHWWTSVIVLHGSYFFGVNHRL